MNATVSWQAEPQSRGTYTILTSCLSTLFISTWSALHLDIPESGKRGQSAVMRFLDKLGWFAIGLLAPEYLLLLAFNQYMAARDLTTFAQEKLEGRSPGPAPWFMRAWGWLCTRFRQHILAKYNQDNHSDVERGPRPLNADHAINTNGPDGVPNQTGQTNQTTADADHLDQSDQPDGLDKANKADGADHQEIGVQTTPPQASWPMCSESSSSPRKRVRKHPWTITHSFFAIMGGFVLQDPHDTPMNRYLPAWQGNGVLTEYGVRDIMRVEPDLIPDVPIDELLDHSKADGLAKMILTWQVLWFCLSCLNRAVQHLPLSLLEVNTIAHALCALLTYAAWWKKPSGNLLLSGRALMTIGSPPVRLARGYQH
ncbi:hypothetical protein C8Q76DRAFT_133316 [Earliella scabrosa]|nr:hypothetical protein C8Q76DRAFT_133316 [Earliella scabrosa]